MNGGMPVVAIKPPLTRPARAPVASPAASGTTKGMSVSAGNTDVLIGSAPGNDPETLSFAGPKDAGIAVSFTPYASSIVDFSRRLAARNVPLVVITDSPMRPLVTEDGAWFEVAEDDFAGVRPLSATMVLGMAVAVAVAEARA